MGSQGWAHAAAQRCALKRRVLKCTAALKRSHFLTHRCGLQRSAAAQGLDGEPCSAALQRLENKQKLRFYLG
jgi:hypothetical protein